MIDAVSMLDFYREHGISPVTQDVSDLKAHFARRAFLYRALGVPPTAIEGKYVLEVGPGSGQNALYTLSLNPGRYVALEPNPVGAEAVRKLIPDAYVVEGQIEYMSCEPRFDVVLCEGLLGLCGSEPTVLLEHLVRQVKVGGVLVITCIDAISDHAEVLRRALAQRHITPEMSLAEQVDALRPVFTAHLTTLSGMTRNVDDWIVDNLLNPASIGPTFSIPEACEALEGRCELLGCSPRFILDWRWYKQGQAGNQWAIDAYWANAHNLYDYRLTMPARSPAMNRELLARCLQVRAQVQAGEFVDASRVETDIGWFGRGQQYLSFVRTV